MCNLFHCFAEGFPRVIHNETHQHIGQLPAFALKKPKPWNEANVLDKYGVDAHEKFSDFEMRCATLKASGIEVLKRLNEDPE